MDWVLPTDEILAKVEMMAAEQHRKASAPATASYGNGEPVRDERAHNGIASRLRLFALHFKRDL